MKKFLFGVMLVSSLLVYQTDASACVYLPREPEVLFSHPLLLKKGEQSAFIKITTNRQMGKGPMTLRVELQEGVTFEMKDSYDNLIHVNKYSMTFTPNYSFSQSAMFLKITVNPELMSYDKKVAGQNVVLGKITMTFDGTRTVDIPIKTRFDAKNQADVDAHIVQEALNQYEIMYLY